MIVDGSLRVERSGGREGGRQGEREEVHFFLQ